MLNLNKLLIRCAFLSSLLSLGAVTPTVLAQGRTYEASPDQMLSELTAETVKTRPEAALLLKNKSLWKNPDAVVALLQHNVELYHYLPDKLRSHSAIIQTAKSLGIPTGALILQDRRARVEPSKQAAVSKGPSYTPNGYLVDKRPEIAFKKGDRVAVFDRKVVNGEVWLQVAKKRSYSRDQAKKDYEMLVNVGGIAFEDFSFSKDAGWIPESQTKEALLSRQVKTGLLHFEGVENGDLAVYVSFREKSFSDFSDPAYVILSAAESGRLSPGDQVRISWIEPLLNTEEPTLHWVAIPKQP